MSTLALTLTPAACVWLETTTSARVLSVFERACNLVNAEGELLALVTHERGLNPFAMLIDGKLAGVRVEDEVKIKGERLEIGDLEIRDWRAAAVWNPKPEWEAVRGALSDAVLDELLAVGKAEAPEGSLLELSPHLADQPNLFFGRAQRGTTALVLGLQNKNRAEYLAGARLLAGAGGGLTPAGDDFVVGVLLAGWAGLYGEMGDWRLEIVEAVAPLTTTLSAAYVRAAARGECALYWHKLLEALVAQRDWRLEIRELVRVGHTSGADALAGFCAIRHLPLTRHRFIMEEINAGGDYGQATPA